MSLVDVAQELYGLPLAEFVPTRDARAAELRKSGDRDLGRAVGTLRRPTTAAWAVNLLTRAQGDELDQLVTLGAALREAQDALDGDELRELNRTRHRLVAALRAQVERLAAGAGQRLSEPVARQVEATLHAVMADDAAAAAVRTGLLVRELESTGLEPVDVAGAVALPDVVAIPTGRVDSGPRESGARSSAAPRGGRSTARDSGADARAAAERRREEELAAARAAARAEHERAEAQRAAAEDEMREARRAADELAARDADSAARLERLRQQVEAAEEDRARLAQDLAAARADAEAAGERLEAARAAADEARARLEEVT